MFRQSLVRLQAIQKLAVTPNKYNSKSSAFNLKPELPKGLFYHPSPSSLNPLITPKAFLPEGDIRKTSDVYFPEEKKIQESIQYMPVLQSPKEPSQYKLAKEDIENLQKLRDENKLSRKELREQFGISNYFLGLATDSNDAKRSKTQKIVTKSMRRWGKKKTHARELRQKRQELWKSNA